MNWRKGPIISPSFPIFPARTRGIEHSESHGALGFMAAESGLWRAAGRKKAKGKRKKAKVLWRRSSPHFSSRRHRAGTLRLSKAWGGGISMWCLRIVAIARVLLTLHSSGFSKWVLEHSSHFLSEYGLW